MLAFLFQICQYSNALLVFSTVFLFTQTLVAFAFVMVTLFNQAKLGGTLGSLGVMALRFVAYALDNGVPRWVHWTGWSFD